MASTILPMRENERVTWGLNFEAEFAALATALGFTPQEGQTLAEDSAALVNGELLLPLALANR